MNFSAEVSGTVPAAVAAAPVINSLTMRGRSALVVIASPVLDEDGVALQTLPMKVHVYYKTSSFAESTPEAEDAAGTAKVSATISDATVGVQIDGLERGHTYYFAACVE